MPLPTLSIIIPVLNEATALPLLLENLLPLYRSTDVDIVVVDGGSSDGSPLVAELAGFCVLSSEPGRACQTNAGAAVATGDILLFLHADTLLPPGADQLIRQALQRTGRVWGRFDVWISGDAPALRLISLFVNLRSRVTGIATGDQAMFVHRDAFVAVGGFPPQPLMEDIELSRRLRTLSRPACGKLGHPYLMSLCQEEVWVSQIAPDCVFPDSALRLGSVPDRSSARRIAGRR